MVLVDDYTGVDKGWNVHDSSTHYEYSNPFRSDWAEIIESLRESTKSLIKLKRDDNSRMYSSIQDKPKLMPITVQKQPNHSIRNNLICKRTIKKGINYKNR